MIRRHLRPALLPLALLCAPCLSLITGCQDVSETKVVLTQQQWREVEQQILKAEPTPQHVLHANFDNEIELLGFDVEPKQLKAGEPATFTWYWKALEAPSKNWEIFIHLDAKDNQLRQGLDHHPVKGLYKTSLWKKGQIIKDVQTITIREDFPTGPTIPYIGLYHGDGIEGRKLIVNNAKKTNDRRAIGPELSMQAGSGAPAATAEQPEKKPLYTPRKLDTEMAKTLTLDGKLDEDFWQSIPKIEIGPFGEGQSFETWAKVVYTDDALIVAAYLQDSHIWGEFEERDSRTWEQEVFEVFIDTNRDAKDYLELQITPRNVIFDANFTQRLGAGEGSTEDQIKLASSWNYEGLEHAVYIDGSLNDVENEDKFWSVEIKLPFANFPGAEGKMPADGTQWAMNMYRFDRPAKKQSFAYAWSRQTRNSFHDVPMFGTLHFGPMPRTMNVERLNLLGKPGALRNLNKQQRAQELPSPQLQRQPGRLDPASLRKSLKLKKLQQNPPATP